MTAVTIISGFLGAGKTTLIREFMKKLYAKEQIVLIENEFGEIGIDAAFLENTGIAIKEINSGCICCSLVGDFKTALLQVLEQFHPDRIIFEPSGVGKLSDVLKAVKEADARLLIDKALCVVDVKKGKLYARNFGEFFRDQIEYADGVLLSRTQYASAEEISEAVMVVRGICEETAICTTPWEELDQRAWQNLFAHFKRKQYHHFSQEEEAHARHHHAHDEKHHHHHADEVFASFARETIKLYTKEEVKHIAQELAEQESYGTLLRAKGILLGEKEAYQFDVTPHEYEVRCIAAQKQGRYCVIGAKLNEDALRKLFEEGS